MWRVWTPKAAYEPKGTENLECKAMGMKQQLQSQKQNLKVVIYNNIKLGKGKGVPKVNALTHKKVQPYYWRH